VGSEGKGSGSPLLTLLASLAGKGPVLGATAAEAPGKVTADRLSYA
jgi:hypothetical protein